MFKNLQVYRLPAPWNFSAAQMEAALKKHNDQNRAWCNPEVAA